ncbi:hypothetical protein SCP_0510110 [Sparassis crispa]|uniref:DNA 3'-5' helicase n=1 Tax=Sparassis crispa TaxID=139825 RepID=A0A401GP22_9APHY|nr:hypothetical protein SCP_0510110 [Sparassis crispa]GBE83952.1 hypothetical protein SCP_0510110 [Sparassis crispa]
MPLFDDDTHEKIVLVISPLNALEHDQAERFKSMGLEATAVNGEVYNPRLHKEIVSGKYRLLLTSPEMCLEHAAFSALMRSPEFMKNIASIVVDEAHCISQWGGDFRKKFAELEKLRSFVPRHIPFLITSATLPPPVLSEVHSKLHFDAESTFHLNLGNDRPNITPIVQRLSGGASALNNLDFLVKDAASGTLLTRTIVFFNTRKLAQAASEYLQSKLPDDMKDQVNFLHACRTKNARKRVMKEFREGKINILCATEAAGMGMDIQDIIISVQYMLPSSLSVWLQRAGRAGRSGALAFAIFFVEPSVFQKKGAKKRSKKKTTTEEEHELLEAIERLQVEPEQEGEIAGTNVEYKKKTEQGLRDWIDAVDCRRHVTDRYFSNPPASPDLQALMKTVDSEGQQEDVDDTVFICEQASSFPCCDNCVKKRRKAGEELSDGEMHVMNYINLLGGFTEDSDQDWDNEGDEDEDDEDEEVPDADEMPREFDHLAH